MPRFAPIAIVGRACLLPGADSPEALWSNVRSGTDSVSEAPAGRWGVDPERIRCFADDPQPDQVWTNRGGYVRDLDFDSEGFEVPASTLAGLDPVFLWALHTGRAALRDAGLQRAPARTGAIFGNLGFPTRGMSAFAESVWGATEDTVDPRNRFGAGLPALLLGRALGLDAPSLALDAACASSLYAIKYACDRLHDGEADVMLAGAVNCADDLFIHVGFGALRALSKSGRSRPFHADADGLLPAEGAGFVVLKRLCDARRDGDTIVGVIRGVGLSNDGRGRGFLVPSAQGQAAALRMAYEVAGLTPADVDYVECHATGTQLGDATELESLREVFGDAGQGLPLGSLKANVGHLITAAGVAGLIKVCEAMKTGELPPTPHLDRPTEALSDTGFRVPCEPEPWPAGDTPRAAVSAFGFGGNNAHLIVEAHDPSLPADGELPDLARVAIVAAAVRAAGVSEPGDVLEAIANPTADRPQSVPLSLDPLVLGIPPNDLRQTLPQQLAMLQVAAQVADAVPSNPDARVGAFVGMSVDPSVARYGARWRHGEGFIDALTAAGVIGAMPNIPTNRINRHLDLQGGSCSVFAEELSGIRALQLAARAVSRGELDAAVVGSVDLGNEPVQVAAIARATERTGEPGDAAVAVVLRREADARAEGQDILAVLGPAADDAALWGPDEQFDATAALGHCHTATGLLHVAAAAWATHRRLDGRGLPTVTPRASTVRVRGMEGSHAQVGLLPADAAVAGTRGDPVLAGYAAASNDELLEALRADRRTRIEDLSAEPHRLVIVAVSAQDFEVRCGRAEAHLREGAPPGPGVHARQGSVSGDLAFVYTSAGSAYAGAGLDLLRDLPQLGEALAARFESLPAALSWVEGSADAEQRLWSASAVSQLHTELSRGVLGLVPQAAIGYSSGESNSLFALGAWRDVDAMRQQARDSALFTRNLAGEFQTVTDQWGADARWQMWSVLAPRTEVEARIADNPRIELAIVHSDADVVIGGDATALAPVLDAIGRGRCQALDYNMCVHVPQLEPVADAYLQLHRRPVHSVPGVRFYSGGRPDAYVPNTEACAYAILSQARNCLDVPAMIEQAWADGVRIFVEHGPGGSCSRWILDILGPDRRPEASVVSLDRKGQGAWGAVEAGAALLAAGVPVRLERLLDALRSSPRPEPLAGPLSIPLHFAEVVPPAPLQSPSDLHVMKPAPTLPPVLGSHYSPAIHAPQPSPAPSVEPEAVAHSVVAPPSDPVPAAAPIPAQNAAPPSAAAAPMHPGARMLAELSGLHTRFIQQQAAVHTAFLEGRARMLEGAGVGHTPTPAATPKRAATRPLSSTTAPSLASPVIAAAAAPAAPVVVAPVVVASKPFVAHTHQAKAHAQTSVTPPPSGPTLTREQLEIDASGRISEIFGPLFEQQDGYTRQVRMPEPPLLLADRVTGIDAEPGVLSKGTIWTETDVCHDSWYLNRGRMPGGIFIECGQADLMLISWMGADFVNKGERVYRLLGCTLTFGGDLPKPGETLQYDIHVDGHAKHDAVRLFFFHYDCRVDGDIRLSVRDGQAGFFTDEELADSDGILWTPQDADIVAQPRLEAPDQLTTRRSFSRTQIEAFADGRPWECFGEGFEHSQTHSHTPTIQGGRMLFLEEVTEFNSEGGPWGRGYLRARTPVKPDDWFFDGHFKNDPCMPGTLMFEGCFQALSLYLSALGYTLRRDSWRFQPVPGEPIEMRCRGQVTPTSKELIYEVFVEEIVAGPVPTIYADLLCTVDGRKAFHAKRVGLQLVPDWPLESWTHLLEGHVEPKPVATVATEEGEFAFDYKSLLACAWGRPSDAFGPMYRPFDSHRSAPRLPSPPYHFMSRILELKGDIGVAKAGAEVVVEYDVPPDAWYLHDNGTATMPFAVLLEAALQPCGWLASYVGSVLEYDNDLLFRNLDGTGTQLREVFADAGTLRTEVKLTALSKAGGMVITSFELEMLQGSERVYTLKTVFGCFPEEAFENQAGLPISDADRALLEQPSTDLIDLDARPASLYGEGATLPGSKLDMLNRITGVWPQGGAAGLGAMRAEKDVRSSDWYFKAHFFQDPVQPGSLGIEAMIQLLQAYMLLQGMDAGVSSPRFEPLAVGHEMKWSYRGQVTPRNELVQCTLEITDKGRDELGSFAIATASLWVDGLRIYSAEGLGMRIVSGSPPPPRSPDDSDETVTFGPATDRWLADHCPTWNEPALPMMSLVDIIASAVPGPIASVRDVAVHGFIDVGRPRTLRTEQTGDDTRTQVRVLDESGTLVASGTVLRGEAAEAPAPWPRLEGASMPDPYATGSVFHGPAFQLWRGGVRTGEGASTTLNAGGGSVPVGRLHPALLDAALHAIPHDQLSLWSEATGDEVVAYPARVPSLTFHGPTPQAGSVRCEVRFGGLLAPGLPAFDLQLIVGDGVAQRVWAHGRILEACFPKGPLGAAAPEERRAFLRDKAFVPGLRLSRADGEATRLTQAEVDACDWMPGTVLGIYGRDKAADIAVLEHIAHVHRVHPSCLPAVLPLNPPSIELAWEGDEVVVRDAPARSVLDPAPVRPFWARQAGHDQGWVGRDLWEGLLQQFVGRVLITDPDDFAQVRTRPALFLANHQVQIESLLITHLLAGLTDRAVTTMANAKHQQRWIGWILRLLFGGPEHRDPDWILYFDQSQPQSMAGLLAGLEPGLRDGSTSFFLHPQGTRSQHAAESVTTVSSTILDLAVRLQLPIVPVRFTGGLPIEPIEGKLEFPVGYGAQDYWIGPSIQPETLSSLPYAQRSRCVVEAIESLGPVAGDDEPAPPDLGLCERVASRRSAHGTGEVESVFVEVLRGLHAPSAQSREVLQAVLEGRPLAADQDSSALRKLVQGLRKEG
ncbi:MAG: 1-acyl-sn-glycerol-3-phosphate acyltransferase [Nannocystaceae bacterium]|nr:1-acyl-sn-glycerol-3-phosphate acyltransferase [Nannocystaceae bacterium]